jgi:hypothetical protein
VETPNKAAAASAATTAAGFMLLRRRLIVEIENVPRRGIRSMAGDIQLRIRIPHPAEFAFSLE